MDRIGVKPEWPIGPTQADLGLVNAFAGLRLPTPDQLEPNDQDERGAIAPQWGNGPLSPPAKTVAAVASARTTASSQDATMARDGRSKERMNGRPF